MSKQLITLTVLSTSILLIACNRSQELTDKDRAEIIRLTLERAVVAGEIPDYHLLRDKRNIVLSKEKLDSRLVPEIDGVNLILLDDVTIQERSERADYFSYLMFNDIDEKPGQVVVTLAIFHKTMRGGFAASFTIEYRKEKEKWQGQVVSETVS